MASGLKIYCHYHISLAMGLRPSAALRAVRAAPLQRRSRKRCLTLYEDSTGTHDHTLPRKRS